MNAHTSIYVLVLNLLILAYFFVLSVSSNSDICPNSACNPSEPRIRFPFRLKYSQPNQCGYPGFDLICDSFTLTTLLQLQNSSLSVQAIDYAAQEMWLNDPNHCLPRILLTLNLSATPFRGAYVQSYSLFNCSSYDIPSFFNPIACLGGSNYTVVATAASRGAMILYASSCWPIGSISVPVRSSSYAPVWTSDLSEDIRLTWDDPRCGRCESKGGHCWRKGNSTYDVECTIHRRGLPGGARFAIILAAGIPAFLFVAGFVCFLISRLKACARRRHPAPGILVTSVVVPQPIVISGLDEAAIESFPKTVLGESRRLPNPEDNICAICLGEYKPKEMLRTVPACQHCFHSSCIDEWLRFNATCPLCRKYQKQLPESAPAPPSNPGV